LNPILDWYGSRKASNVSSRRTSRENSPAKTVRFNVPEPLGSTHSNAELLAQLQAAHAERDAFAEQARNASGAYDNQASQATAALADSASLAVQLKGAQDARAKLQQQVDSLKEEVRGLESFVTSSAKKGAELYAASAKLKELGLHYSENGAWVRDARRNPTDAERSLAKHLFKDLDLS